jgi:hypothetical protein
LHCALLLSTALQVDGKLKHKGRDPKRQVSFADACGFVDGMPLWEHLHSLLG